MVEDDDDDDAGNLTFKLASEPWEFEQIHRLNYQTFVEEIPQHPANDRGVLVDRFHDRNTYMICLRGGREVIAMLAMRCERPFSLDQKLGDIDHYLPPGRWKIAEIRLLAARPEDRGGRVFYRLLRAGSRHLARSGYDLAVISGTTRQLKLYRHMGFVAFGPLIGTPGAMYQPMYVTRERFAKTASALQMPLPGGNGGGGGGGRVVSFLPGPVDVSDAVAAAMAGRGRSHRSAEFVQDVSAARRALCRLTGARHVQILSGSGTLANDVVAARLALAGGRGVVLSNGEFGERLVDHGRRARLAFDVVRAPWGEALDLAAVDEVLAEKAVAWLWGVHCETSTGVLNDLCALKRLCGARGIKFCADCISSVGTTAVDLAGVHLATGVSGKGLRAFAGLGMVFHDEDICDADDRLPRSLDLGYAARMGGVPFTICSNLVDALRVAVSQVELTERVSAIAECHSRLRAGLARLGLTVLARPECAAPAVLTVPLPAEVDGAVVGDALASAGLLISYRSDYLRRRNWIQLCLMGGYDGETIDRLLQELCKVLTAAPATGRDAPASATILLPW